MLSNIFLQIAGNGLQQRGKHILYANASHWPLQCHLPHTLSNACNRCYLTYKLLDCFKAPYKNDWELFFNF